MRFRKLAGTKKKKHAKKKIEKVQSLGSWSIGDMAYGKAPNGDILYGEVLKFYPKDNQGPAVLILTIPDYKSRTVLLSSLTEQKPKKKRSLRT